MVDPAELFNFDFRTGPAQTLVDPVDGVEKLYTSVESVTYMARALAAMVGAAVLQEEIEQPDIILALARGGWSVGEVVARSLGMPAFVCQSSSLDSYHGEGIRGKVRLGQHPEAHRLHRMNVLIVDDVADECTTLQEAVNQAGRMGVRRARTAVLYDKLKGDVRPDFAVAQTSLWINFPYDQCDKIGNWFQRQLDIPREERDQAALEAYFASATPLG